MIWLLPIALVVVIIVMAIVVWSEQDDECTVEEKQQERRLTSFYNNNDFTDHIVKAGFNPYSDGRLIDFRYALVLPVEKRIIAIDPGAYINGTVLRAELKRLRRNVNMRAFVWNHRNDKKPSDIQNIVSPSSVELEELNRFAENLNGSTTPKVRKGARKH